MEKNFDIKQLLQKPIAMMTGEELTFLIGSSMEAKRSETTPIVQKRTYYGIEGIAQVFGCMQTWHFRWLRKRAPLS